MGEVVGLAVGVDVGGGVDEGALEGLLVTMTTTTWSTLADLTEADWNSLHSAPQIPALDCRVEVKVPLLIAANKASSRSSASVVVLP